MRFTVETSLANFDAWSGGFKNLEELKCHDDAFDYIESMIEEYLAYTVEASETTINDILWFDMWDMLEEGGFVNENHEWIDYLEEEDDEEE